jgi:two-component system, cell cycle response regulator DivK
MADALLVLIVDDAPDNREAYAEYLRFRGFRTIEAGTGAEAMDQARQHVPDVILLDLRLPDIDGLEVCKYVRGAATLQHAKIIAVSAAVFPSDVADALDSGCDLFLQKPCLPDTLVAEIERLLEHPVRL